MLWMAKEVPGGKEKPSNDEEGHQQRQQTEVLLGGQGGEGGNVDEAEDELLGGVAQHAIRPLHEVLISGQRIAGLAVRQANMGDVVQREEEGHQGKDLQLEGVGEAVGGGRQLGNLKEAQLFVVGQVVLRGAHQQADRAEDAEEDVGDGVLGAVLHGNGRRRLLHHL